MPSPLQLAIKALPIISPVFLSTPKSSVSQILMPSLIPKLSPIFSPIPRPSPILLPILLPIT